MRRGGGVARCATSGCRHQTLRTKLCAQMKQWWGTSVVEGSGVMDMGEEAHT